MLGDGTELEAEILLDMARTVTSERKGYAKATLYRAIQDWLEMLPAPESDDTWSTLTGLLTGLADAGRHGPPPRWATPADPTAPHELHTVRAMSLLMGRPLMPWQEQVARVATERTAEGTYRYQTVVVTVPRQSGKTTLLRSVMAARAATRHRRAWITAQTGKDARARWQDLVKDIRRSPLAPFCDVKLSAGNSALTFLRNESTLSPFAPTAESLHGYTATDVAIDEAFAFTDDQGTELMGAVSPTMATEDDSQLWIISTAGNPESTWLKGWVDKGRAAVSDPTARLAYFEWSADDGDPYAPEITSFHPAMGFTVSRAKLLAEAEGTPVTEWQRAYLNRWVTSVADPLLPDELIAGLHDPDQPQPAGRIAVAYELAYDMSRASIVAAWADPDDPELIHTRTVAEQAGTGWLMAAIPATLDALGPAAELCADDAGQTRQITDQLRTQLGLDPITLDGRAFTTACGRWVARARAGTITTDASASLADGVKVAATRAVLDGWALSRAHSGGPIDNLVANVVATRLIDTTQNTEAPQVVGLDD